MDFLILFSRVQQNNLIFPRLISENKIKILFKFCTLLFFSCQSTCPLHFIVLMRGKVLRLSSTFQINVSIGNQFGWYLSHKVAFLKPLDKVKSCSVLILAKKLRNGIKLIRKEYTINLLINVETIAKLFKCSFS